MPRYGTYETGPSPRTSMFEKVNNYAFASGEKLYPGPMGSMSDR